MQVRPMIVIDVLLSAHHGSWFLAVKKLFPWRQALICLLLICCDLKMKKMIFFGNWDISIESTQNFFIDSIKFKWFLRSLSLRWYRVSDSVWKGPRRIRARFVLDRYFEPCYVALRPTEGVLGKNLLEIEVDSMKPHVKPKVPSKDYSLISLLGRDFPTGETHRWCGDALPSNRNFGCRPPRNLY